MTSFKTNLLNLAKGLIHLPFFILIAFPGFLIWVSLPTFIEENVKQNSITYAKATVEQFKTLRGYYTKHVVYKVLEDGNLKVSHLHKDKNKTIPLPATMIHDLSSEFSNQNLTLNLFSGFPFPNRKDRVLDSFQTQAWEELKTGEQKSFLRIEELNDRTLMRVAIPDKMVSAACVSCHNSHPDTPKTGWKIGDIRGVLEATLDITDQLDSGKTMSNILFIMIITFSILVGLISHLVNMLNKKE